MASGSLTADSGTYTIAGTTAALRASFVLVAVTSAYSLTGTNVTLKFGKLPAETGSYSLTGSATTLAGGFVLPATTDSYVLTGTAIALTATLVNKLEANSGSYVLNGQAIDLTFAGFSAWVPIADKTTIWTDV